MSEEKGKGLRYNGGKPRFDLVPPYAQIQYVNVLTKGVEKYAERNWEKGMPWSTVLASMKRHISAFEMGEDFDQETGLLHMAHVMCNAAFMTEYYKIYPQGDNRPIRTSPKIGLDIDEVLASFVSHVTDYFDIEVPNRYATFWSDSTIKSLWHKIENDKDFWMTIPVLTHPEEIPFEPHCYITSRSIPEEWTKEWLHKNGFPDVKLYSVGRDASKVEVAIESGVEIFVDDRYENFIELTNAGVFTYLFTADHNIRYNVGHRRIKSLKELIYGT